MDMHIRSDVMEGAPLLKVVRVYDIGGLLHNALWSGGQLL
jgi:hypothetical protein